MSFIDKVAFFENSAFIQRRVSLYATAAASPLSSDPAVAIAGEGVGEAGRQTGVGTSAARAAALAGSTKNALLAQHWRSRQQQRQQGDDDNV